MKAKLMLIFAVVLLITASFFCGHRIGKNKANAAVMVQVDTITLIDTITVTKPIYYSKKIKDTILVPVRVEERVRDTIYVRLPREERVYKDSSYRAVVSGYMPSLDSINIYQTNRTVYNTKIFKEAKRWGLGLQGGVGVGKGGLTPYVGVGVSYNLLSW